MANEKTLKERNSHYALERIVLVFGGIAAISIAGLIFLTMPITGENEIYLNTIFAGLVVCMILLLAFIIWLYDWRLKQILECEHTQVENDKKRALEKEQAELNHTYRLEAIKWERIHQIVKLVLEKENPKDKKTDKEKDTINIPVAKSLIAAIKEIKEEIEKTETIKTE
jgi:heme/copper-type cytochrome/quinol oxidase subunit 1